MSAPDLLSRLAAVCDRLDRVAAALEVAADDALLSAVGRARDRALAAFHAAAVARGGGWDVAEEERLIDRFDALAAPIERRLLARAEARP